MVEKPAERVAPGSVVDIVDRDSQWVGRGFYNGHSRITLRVLTTDQRQAIDAQPAPGKNGSRARGFLEIQ